MPMRILKFTDKRKKYNNPGRKLWDEEETDMKRRVLKKILTIALSAVLIGSMAGCGGEDATETSQIESAQETVTESESDIEASKTEESIVGGEHDTADAEESKEEQAAASHEPGEIYEDAVTLAKNMKLGWNLGNTLDAEGGNGLDTEISWGQPRTTHELISYVRDCGFTTIRIPTTWHKHIKDGVIDEAWMDRVQEVVDWSLEEGFYVILNSHHDCDQYYPSKSHLAESKEYIKNVWTQVAERFKDYDEHLIFESMNEPRLKGTDIEWWFSNDDAKGIESIECIVELNQVFVDTVRNGGSKNETRFLMVPSAIGSPDNALNDHFSMPEDTISDHLILEVHAYTPYDFAMNKNGYDTWRSDKASELNFMGRLKGTFINNGYGVVIDEFGATNKDNLNARCAWARDYCGRASSMGISCVLWDNGGTGVGEENFGMIDRKNLSVYYPELLEAMLQQYK